jgi:hypothetical protein
MKRILAIAIAAVLMGACGSSSRSSPPTTTRTPVTLPPTTTKPATRSLIIKLALKTASLTITAPFCEGSGGFSDINSGADVTIYDGSGTILGNDNLGPGVSMSPLECDFVVNLKTLPMSAFYSIGIGNRGKLNYSAAQLDADHDFLELTLGNGT